MKNLILSILTIFFGLAGSAQAGEKKFGEDARQLLAVTSQCLKEFGQAMKDANGIKSAVQSGSFAESTYTVITQHQSIRGIVSIAIPRAKLEIVQKWDSVLRTFRYSCKVTPVEKNETNGDEE